MAVADAEENDFNRYYTAKTAEAAEFRWRQQHPEKRQRDSTEAAEPIKKLRAELTTEHVETWMQQPAAPEKPSPPHSAGQLNPEDDLDNLARWWNSDDDEDWAQQQQQEKSTPAAGSAETPVHRTLGWTVTENQIEERILPATESYVEKLRREFSGQKLHSDNPYRKRKFLQVKSGAKTTKRRAAEEGEENVVKIIRRTGGAAASLDNPERDPDEYPPDEENEVYDSMD